MEKIFKVKVVQWYGRECYEPDCELSSLLCSCMNRNTLGQKTMRIIKDKNFKIAYKSLEPSEFLDGIGAKRQVVG